MLKLMYITNDISEAIIAQSAGVDRIFIDLEKIGKMKRQGHLNTHIANHNIRDIKKIKNELSEIELLVRINPINPATIKEIDESINQGADILMLPMFMKKEEVRFFVKHVNGRAKTCILIETAQAFVRINEILDIKGIDEVHIGLNDLHLSFGLDFMFELLSEGIVEYIADVCKKRGINFGFGGIAPIGKGDIPSEMIIAEHYRIGSNMVILSRAFRNKNEHTFNIKEEIIKVRDFEKYIMSWNNDDFLKNKNNLQNRVRNLANRL